MKLFSFNYLPIVALAFSTTVLFSNPSAARDIPPSTAELDCSVFATTEDGRLSFNFHYNVMSGVSVLFFQSNTLLYEDVFGALPVSQACQETAKIMCRNIHQALALGSVGPGLYPTTLPIDIRVNAYTIGAGIPNSSFRYKCK